MLRAMWIVGLMLTALACYAQKQVMTFVGAVADSSGKPVAGAEVVLYAIHWDDKSRQIHTPVLQSVKTAEDGTFQISHPSGEYRRWGILVFKPGYGVWGKQFTESKTGINVSLPPASPISGVVTTTRGKPLAGVKVRIQHIISPMERFGFMEWLICPDIPALSAITDDGGRFRIDHLPFGAKASLQILAPGYASPVEQAEAGAPPVAIILPREVKIEGRVLYADTRKGVEGVIVHAAPEASYERQSARTDSNGRFVIAQLSPGVHTVWVEYPLPKPNLVATPLVLPKAKEGDLRKCPDILLVPGIPVRGTVRDAQTGQGIGGIQINTQYQRARMVSVIFGPSATSVEDGSFTLYLPEGDWAVQAMFNKQYVCTEREAGISIKRGEKPKELHFTMVRTARAILQVIDPEGNPVEDVMVGGTGLPSKGQEKGVYVLEGLEPNRNYELRLVNEQYTLGAEVSFAAQQGQELRITVRMSPLVAVSGRLVDSDGHPIRQARVTLISKLQVGGPFVMLPWLSASVRPDGRFVLRALPGQYAFLFESQGLAPYSLPLMQIDADKDLGEIVLERVTGFIAGRVLDVNGEPIVGAHVRAYDEALVISREARTDAQGRYRVEGLPPGKRMSISVEAEDLWGRRTGVFVGSTGVDFVLTPSQSRVPATRLKPGSPAPSLSGVRVLSGGSAPRFQGHVVLLQFACAYNQAVEEQSQWLKRLYARYASRGLQVVAIYDASLPLPQLRAYLRTQRLPYMVCTVPAGTKLGWDSTVFRQYEVHSVPSLYLIDHARRLRLVEATPDEVEKALGALLRR